MALLCVFLSLYHHYSVYIEQIREMFPLLAKTL